MQNDNTFAELSVEDPTTVVEDDDTILEPTPVITSGEAAPGACQRCGKVI